VGLATGRGGTANLAATPDKYYSLAPRDLIAGDVQELTVSESVVDGQLSGERGVVLGLGEPQPLTVTLPPAFFSPKIASIDGAP
jgi:hypothetical protein